MMAPAPEIGPARTIPGGPRVRVGRALLRALRRLGAAGGAQNLSSNGAMMTIGAEAIVLSPYWDSSHVLTLWIGHTAAAGAPDPVTMWNKPTTIGQAVAQFELDTADRYVPGVRRAFTRALSQQQFDAAVDFHYNTGAIEVADWVKLWNAGRDADARASFHANWRSPAARRAIEEALFFDGIYPALGSALQVPANPRGILDWAHATRIDIRRFFGGA